MALWIGPVWSRLCPSGLCVTDLNFEQFDLTRASLIILLLKVYRARMPAGGDPAPLVNMLKALFVASLIGQTTWLVNVHRQNSMPPPLKTDAADASKPPAPDESK